MTDVLIELEGQNGEWFTVSGLGAGDRGVYLAPENEGTEFDGLYDAPVKTIWNSTAFQLGASYGGMREEKYQFTLAFHVVGSDENPWRYADSALRKAFSYEKRSKIWVEVEDSRRWLAVQLVSNPRVKVGHDPHGQQYGLVLLPLAAAHPRWMEPEVTDQFVTTKDSTDGSTELGSVRISNPTDSEIWLKWMLQGTSGIKWTLPDFSFGDDRFDRADRDKDRMLVMPELRTGENVRVDTDEMGMEGQVVSSLDTAVYQRMNGKMFLYPIPPYTAETVLPVAVTGAPKGAGLQVRCPRPWTRPWGLE
ncbi:phage tail protein [Nocardia arthritidis]|uniref:Phage tail protein n=1 Tax=Nocardia arthritidis TaxID=228602 RepID=A0A6G9YTG2_9NOCA|nr:phage tail protein [Nocardia arthritidis]QIS16407.1 phage tail protein [Nocardia arthritidis]